MKHNNISYIVVYQSIIIRLKTSKMGLIMVNKFQNKLLFRNQ